MLRLMVAAKLGLAKHLGCLCLSVTILIACHALPVLAGTPGGPTLPPPEKGGYTQSLGMPPVYKGYGGFDLQWYDPGGLGEMSGLASLGVYRDIGSPVVGALAVGGEFYGGWRSTELDGGARFLLTIPAFLLGGGVDYNLLDEDLDFLLRLDLPVRRGGIFGRASVLRLQYLPTRHHSFAVGVSVPMWGKSLGKTRPLHDHVRLPKREPKRLEDYSPESELVQDLAIIRERARWIAQLCMPFAEPREGDPHKAMAGAIARTHAHVIATDSLFPQGHSFAEEIRVYHASLDHAFSLASGGAPLAGGRSTALGREISARAREILLDDVIFPYNTLLGQRKKNDTLIGSIAVAQTGFGRWLLAESDLPRDEVRASFYVFQTLCDIVEENRADLRERWEDSRFVWLPLQYGLKPDEHDTQAEMDAILARAVDAPFTYGNRVWYVINEQFQWEMARSVRRAEDYHVLWVHDFRGRNSQGEPDELAYHHVLNYLTSLAERVEGYDESGKLPIYMIFLDQHYFEANKSRMWMRLLREPLDEDVDLRGISAEWEATLRKMQQRLQRAVEESQLLRIETSQFGEKWLRNRIKVHINITNPADLSFRSLHAIGILPVPDNIMRDHRKIAFYDITEEDPFRGMAMVTGMGIGEHYAGANWEDRAIMCKGPGALAVKHAARELLRNQGFEPDEIPVPLRRLRRPANYDSLVAAEIASQPERLDWTGGLLQLHNETGYNSKPINVAKAVQYTLMPTGSMLKVPDSLWQSYLYASMLTGSALRGCRVFVIAPALSTAPSSGAPQMGRAHELMGRLVVFRNGLADEIRATGGFMAVGLYKPEQGVGDWGGRFKQAATNSHPELSRAYPIHESALEVARNAEAILDSVGYEIRYMTASDSLESPKLHLKANFFSSAEGWDKLLARPEWADVLRQYLISLAEQSGSGERRPNVRAIPEKLEQSAYQLAKGFLADLTPEERESVIYYLSVGSTNMDYRGMVMDGEVQLFIGGWESLSGLIDFLLLPGLCVIIETPEDLDELLPTADPSGPLDRAGHARS
jgi:hypothetical protein